MTANEEVLQKLDKIIAILQIAHKDEIDRARAEITADKVDAAILKAAAKETPAGKLIKAVEAKAKVSDRSVQIHVAKLIERGLLEKTGSGTATTYKTTGLI
jgi:DNA-binding transcriptional ArsR family regulator